MSNLVVCWDIISQHRPISANFIGDVHIQYQRMPFTNTYISYCRRSVLQASILLATRETRNKFDQSLASILTLENTFGALRVLGCPSNPTASGSNGGLTSPVHLVSTLTCSASTRSLSSPDIFAMTYNLSLRVL